MNSRPLLTSSFAGLAAPLLAASFVLTALSACSCAPEPEAPHPALILTPDFRLP